MGNIQRSVSGTHRTDTNLDEMLVDPFCEGFLLHPVALVWRKNRRGEKREEG